MEIHTALIMETKSHLPKVELVQVVDPAVVEGLIYILRIRVPHLVEVTAAMVEAT